MASRKYLLRRSKDNLSVIFGRRAVRVGAHSLGNLEAIASSRVGKINIKNIEESEKRGRDFFELKNIRYDSWFTRNWTSDRVIIAEDIKVAAHGVGRPAGKTKRQAVIDEILLFLKFDKFLMFFSKE